MNLIRIAIERPVAVLAAVLMVVLFGAVALTTIPIQLTPDVNKPIINISTAWRGGAPAEVEREIVNVQEDELKGLRGVEEMSSRSLNGRAEITLEFGVNQNMDRALLEVSNRLTGITDRPAEAEQFSISTSTNEDNAIAWFLLRRLPGNDRDIGAFGEFAEDVIQERLERVPGVSRVNVYGGSERELNVIVDPQRLAQFGLTISQISDALRAANISTTAGDVDEGKRRYVVRTDNQLSTPERVRAVVLRTLQDAETGRIARVTVGDVARVEFGFKELTARLRASGEPAIVINAVRETGANVIETMRGVRAAAAELSRTVVPDAGLHLRLIYDETDYINSAIDLVVQNIYVGGVLAALLLMLFLRSGGATLIVSLAIPVSVVGAFVAMSVLGRSLNVISLAGIAFAVGMVVDAAIVVLENIFRLRQQGMAPARAALVGASQVWGAVLVSALTTVLVFAPVLVMKLEVGQLFRDIAVAISVAVLLSLLVAVTVIPALAKRLLGGDLQGSFVKRRVPVIDAAAGYFVTVLERFTARAVASRPLALAVVASVCGLAAMAAWLLLPKLDYLPEGNRNLIIGFMSPPPGYNLETATGIAARIENAARPHWAELTDDGWVGGEEPRIARFFFIARETSSIVAASAVDEQGAAALIPLLRQPIFSEPGTFGFLTQASLFGRGIGGARSISLDISGPDLEQILDIALGALGPMSQLFPAPEGNQLRPIPGLELGAPEVRVLPDQVRLSDAGLSARDLALTIDAFNDGLRVAEISAEGKRMDLTLRGPHSRIVRTQGIDDLPVVTRSGEILPASSLAQVVVTAGPTEIRHLERARTVSLELRPAPHIPLEVAMERIQSDVIAPLETRGLPPGVKMRMSGTADKLSQTWDAMVVDLILAIVIVYLVMAVLFESFIYPIIILFSVPLAAAGGVGGLAVINLFVRQPFDMLTLLGFVILVGIVVNNAILLVHQSLHHVRNEGMDPGGAIIEATRNRVRPIFMSTLTSVFGMLPLVLFPGAGSELYRGLGSVVLGGLALSALLTLTVVPPLLGVFMTTLERGRSPRVSVPAVAE